MVQPDRRLPADPARGHVSHLLARRDRVGTSLTAVNQGATIAAGHASVVTWSRTGVNYLVPFVVSSIGYLAPSRQPRRSQSER